jgi:hypothetical protein
MLCPPLSFGVWASGGDLQSLSAGMLFSCNGGLLGRHELLPQRRRRSPYQGMCLITPTQMAPESARATITAQVSSDSPHVDVAEFRFCSTFSLTMQAPLFPAVANLWSKNKNPLNSLGCWRV